MFLFDIHNRQYSHVHFIGIGGISMSGLAEILLTEGYNVSGSDMKDSAILKKLSGKGAKIFLDHHESNLQGADLIVYTDAISKDNPELLEAYKQGITTVDRGTFLGQLMTKYKNSIAVAGTHGKTTTTGMISVILDSANLEPTILLGGELDKIGGNVKIGKGDFILTEACEYKGNILKFRPTIGVILNMEEDHLDYFKDISHIVKTFSDFAKSIPRDGYLIVNGDDKYVMESVKEAQCNIVTFGVTNDCDYKANNIVFGEGGLPTFSLSIKDQGSYSVTLSVLGLHNIYNALGAIAATNFCGLDMETVIDCIKDYLGTHRRLDFKGIVNGIKVIDDYAHHPTEIKATLSAISNISTQKTWCIFQPHTYTRTKSLLKDFANSFYEADKVIISDIYAAREKDTGDIHSKDLVNALKNNGVDAIYLNNFEEIKDYVFEKAKDGDIVITMGAGDIHKVGEMMINN